MSETSNPSLQIGELLESLAVHAFFKQILEFQLGYELPAPANVQALTGEGSVFERWVGLLDFAITAPMVRDALTESTTYETAEALLRYYVRKGSHLDSDRDKTDFVVTLLYRRHVKRHTGEEDPVDSFERYLERTLEGLKLTEMTEDSDRLVLALAMLRQRVEEFKHFDQLMDSGVTSKGREYKAELRAGLFHPKALAVVAAYNVALGDRFQALFHDTTKQIKSFATKMQQEGASNLSRVAGDVTVKHVTELDPHRTLQLDYTKAQEQFRKLSQVRKTVELRLTGADEGRSGMPESASAASAAPAAAKVDSKKVALEAAEEAKIRALQDAIGKALAGTSSTLSVRLPQLELTLSPSEAEAYKVPYRDEKSFRADFANSIARLVAVNASLSTELDQFKKKRSSSEYLWQGHADSLRHLIDLIEQQEKPKAEAILALAQQRGLKDKATQLQGSIDRLRSKATEAAALLPK